MTTLRIKAVGAVTSIGTGARQTDASLRAGLCRFREGPWTPAGDPVVMALGFDPIWFGVVLVLLMEMGLITPPIGMNVFALSGVTDVPVGVIFRGVWPFVGAMLLCTIIITIFPQIALFIPNLM